MYAGYITIKKHNKYNIIRMNAGYITIKKHNKYNILICHQQ